MGILIALDGLDGSGKETQTRLLEQALKAQGIPCRNISFPTYDDQMSAAVKLYLSGAFGNDPNAVNGYAASSFFATDRYCSYMLDWKQDYDAGTVILANRYTTANAVHQLSKLPESEYDGFLDWLFDFEFGKLGLPAPDLVLYLCVPPAVSESLVMSRSAETGRATDIHENNNSTCATATARRCIPQISSAGQRSTAVRTARRFARARTSTQRSSPTSAICSKLSKSEVYSW